VSHTWCLGWALPKLQTVNNIPRVRKNISNKLILDYIYKKDEDLFSGLQSAILPQLCTYNYNHVLLYNLMTTDSRELSLKVPCYCCMLGSYYVWTWPAEGRFFSPIACSMKIQMKIL
jgi:hypothetical protein